jgi:hypothetical protein
LTRQAGELVTSALGVDLGLRILAKVMRRLASEADQLRHNREPTQPQYFRFRQAALARDRGGWFDCVFLVDDQSAPQLVIVNAQCEFRPIGPI